MWPELVVEQAAAALMDEAAAAWRYFPPWAEVRRFTVRPLLTPDNYHRHVLALVRRAREELLIHEPDVRAPKAGEKPLRALVDAVIARQRARVQVKIIFRTVLPAQTRFEFGAAQGLWAEFATSRWQVTVTPRASWWIGGGC